jgi:prepilin-type N-terminal cleavage/methylation domain-containing protein
MSTTSHSRETPRVSIQRGAHRRAGFSLVELMVAMIAGSFVIVGAFYMSDVSSRIFSEQLRRSETQMSLRASVELMRRDIGRAGFLSIRDYSEVPGCVATTGPGQVGPAAMDIAPRQVSAARVNLDANGRQELFITGNLTSTDHYFVSASDGMTLQLQAFNEGYRRSFIDPTDGTTFMATRFLETFFANPVAPGRGRMVSIISLGNRPQIFLRDLLGVSMSTPPTLQIVTPLPMNAMGAGCINFNEIAIAPVSTIHYSMQVPGASLARVGGRSYLTGASAAGAMHPVLVRSEYDLAAQADIAGTERVVLDSILDTPAGFQISAVYDNALAPAVNLLHTSTPETLGLAASGQLRSLTIQLIVESSEREEGDAVHTQSVRAGRRLLRFEVMMPNTSRNSGVY